MHPGSRRSASQTAAPSSPRRRSTCPRSWTGSTRPLSPGVSTQHRARTPTTSGPSAPRLPSASTAGRRRTWSTHRKSSPTLPQARCRTIRSCSMAPGTSSQCRAAQRHVDVGRRQLDRPGCSAIENGPDWDSTAIFITYDDCGCFYDHVAPGLNPDGTQEGTRIPMVIVSPYARAGFTDSTHATFASILAYVEQTFGLTPLGINDAEAYPYTNAFDYSQTPLAGIAMRKELISSNRAGVHRVASGLPADPT